MIPPPSYVPPIVVKPPVGAAWGSDLSDPLSYEEGLKAANDARAYAWSVVDKICSGSVCPPPASIAPVLVERIKALDIARNGFEVLTRKGKGKLLMPASLRKAFLERARALVSEADRLNAALWAEDKRNRDRLDTGWSWLKWAGIIVGIYGVASVVSQVAETSRNVRHTIRG